MASYLVSMRGIGLFSSSPLISGSHQEVHLHPSMEQFQLCSALCFSFIFQYVGIVCYIPADNLVHVCIMCFPHFSLI